MIKRLIRPLVHKLPYIKTLRNIINQHHQDISRVLFKFLSDRELSDSEMLIFLELKYGGYVNNITSKIGNKIMKNHTGGDRFNPFYNDYSKMYSEYLHNLKNSKIKLLEVGILKGTGLAVWSQYFNDVDIYGFDWDLGNINANLDNLISLRAFQKNKPKLFQYNQLINNQQWLKENFTNIKFNVIIDDALHSDNAIINTFNEIQPYLSDDFVYFIEDNTSAFKKLEKKYPEYHFDNEGKLTVVTKK